MTDEMPELEWPDRMYLLHPSIKTLGEMITNPERKEYVNADRIEEMRKEKRELVLQSLADSGQAQEAYAEVVRLKEGIQKAIALAKKPYYGYLEDRIDNYYEGFLILEELLKE